MTCAVGGLSARDLPHALGAVLLPESLDGAVAAVARLLTSGGTPAR
jgi:hypothetical protein